MSTRTALRFAIPQPTKPKLVTWPTNTLWAP